MDGTRGSSAQCLRGRGRQMTHEWRAEAQDTLQMLPFAWRAAAARSSPESTNAAICSPVSPCIPGRTCAYYLSVNVGGSWPSRSLVILAGTPAFTAIAARVSRERLAEALRMGFGADGELMLARLATEYLGAASAVRSEHLHCQWVEVDHRDRWFVGEDSRTSEATAAITFRTDT